MNRWHLMLLLLLSLIVSPALFASAGGSGESTVEESRDDKYETEDEKEASLNTGGRHGTKSGNKTDSNTNVTEQDTNDDAGTPSADDNNYREAIPVGGDDLFKFDGYGDLQSALATQASGVNCKTKLPNGNTLQWYNQYKPLTNNFNGFLHSSACPTYAWINGACYLSGKTINFAAAIAKIYPDGVYLVGNKLMIDKAVKGKGGLFPSENSGNYGQQVANTYSKIFGTEFTCTLVTGEANMKDPNCVYIRYDSAIPHMYAFYYMPNEGKWQVMNGSGKIKHIKLSTWQECVNSGGCSTSTPSGSAWAIKKK